MRIAGGVSPDFERSVSSFNLPIHGFNLKGTAAFAGIVLPIALMIVAGLVGKMWLVWIAVAYVAAMLAVIARIRLKEVEQGEQYDRWHEGQCMYCGYNLQGNESGVCPECGKEIPPPPAKPDKLW